MIGEAEAGTAWRPELAQIRGGLEAPATAEAAELHTTSAAAGQAGSRTFEREFYDAEQARPGTAEMALLSPSTANVPSELSAGPAEDGQPVGRWPGFTVQRDA